MNKLFVVAVATLVFVALSSVDAQPRVVRVPRVPRGDLVKKSEEYKDREVPRLLRGHVRNYAAIGREPRVVRTPKLMNSSKDTKPSAESVPATKAKPTSETGGGGLLKLSMPEDLSATGDGNFLANLTNNKFDVEDPTGATGAETGETGETGATSVTGATGIEKEPILTGPTGVATSVSRERHRRKVEENATKIAKDSGEEKPKLSTEEIMRRRIDERRRRAGAGDESKDNERETDKLTEKDRKLQERIRAVDGKPAPPKAAKKEKKKKQLKKKQDTKEVKDGKEQQGSIKPATGSEGQSKVKDGKEQQGSIKSATGSQGQSNSADVTKIIDTVIEKERVKRGEIKAPVNASSSKPNSQNVKETAKVTSKNSTSGKKDEKVIVQKKNDAERSTGLYGVDLNKAHVYDPTLDGLPKQYAWIKSGRMGSIIFRQFKKLQAATSLRPNLPANTRRL